MSVLWHVCRKFGPSHVESEITLPRVNAHISLDTLNSSDLSSSRSYLSVSLVFHIPFFLVVICKFESSFVFCDCGPLALLLASTVLLYLFMSVYPSVAVLFNFVK